VVDRPSAIGDAQLDMAEKMVLQVFADLGEIDEGFYPD
jgi:hypothetical protein